MKILITGGASGLGKKIIEKIHSNNEVHFTYNNSKESSDNILLRYKNVYSYRCDFTNSLDIKLFLKDIEKINFDVLINNYYAGLFLDKHFLKTDTNDFLKAFENNILPVIKISKFLLQKFKKQKKGLILSVSSSAMSSPPVGSSVYVIIKSIINQLSLVWNAEFNKYNVESKIISPGFMKTDLTSNIDERIVDLYFNTISKDELNETSNLVKETISKHFK